MNAGIASSLSFAFCRQDWMEDWVYVLRNTKTCDGKKKKKSQVRPAAAMVA
jgi:hypothetical protein